MINRTILTTAAALLLFLSRDGLAHRPLVPDPPRQFHTDRQGDNGEPVYLTPYLESGDIEGALDAARVVDPLPDVGVVDGYAAFITVDEPNEGHIFFWFFPATEVDPSDAPVVVWLQGGPGSSSMFGLFEIHGPISVVYDENDNIVGEEREYTWSRRANMLYIDQPVGTGYSHINQNALRTDIGQSTDDLFEFLQQFFAIFEDYQQNDFFVFGESYAGKFVPELGRKIYEENESGNPDIEINLVGVGIGDGFMSPVDTAVVADYLYELALVDEKQREALVEIEDEIRESAANDEWEEATEGWQTEEALYLFYMGCDYVYEATQCNYDDEEDNYEEYVQRSETRIAIHVGDTGYGTQSVFSSMRGDFMKSAQEAVEFLLDRMPVLIYDGNFDIICNHPGILNMFEKMETWSDIEEYYSTDRTLVNGDDGDMAGYLKSVGNLRMYVMRNSGHMVPRSQPKYAYEMFTSFIEGTL